MTMRTEVGGVRRGWARSGRGAAGAVAALAGAVALGGVEIAIAGSRGYVPFTADGPRIERVEARRPCARPGDTVRAVGRYLGAVSVYAFGEGSRRGYRRQLTVVRRDDRSLVLRLPADVPPPRVRLVIRYGGTGNFAPRERAPVVRICAPARESGGRAAGAAGRLGSALGGRAAVDSARAKVPTTPRTLRPDLLRRSAPPAVRHQPGKGWAAPGVARAPDARTRAAGAGLQDLMRVRREGARGTVRVREVRLEDGRKAPDGWRDWKAVAVLENTDPSRPAAVRVFAWGRTDPWVLRTAREDRPQPRVGVYDLGWHVLRPRQTLRVRLRQPVTWGECVRVWLGGEGARRPVRGRPTPETSGGVEACKGLPQRWRVTLFMGIHEVYDDGDNESPTRWKVCLDLDGERRCNWFKVYDGQRRAGYWLSVEKTYGTSALRGRSANASLKVVDYDDLLRGGEDDVAHANLSSGVPGLRWPERPYDTMRLRAGVYRQGEFSSGVDRTEGPSGRYQTFATYEPLE